MAKGNTALLDALGAFLVAIALVSVYYNIKIDDQGNGMLAVQRNRLRQEFYRILSTGNATALLTKCIEEGAAETGTISLSLQRPYNTTFISFFVSQDGRLITCYIAKKG